MGMGDWDLCCSNPPARAKESWCGFLCYEDTEACENFKEKKIMTENFSPELINECAKDLCFYSDKCECQCAERNCETLWEAEKLLRAGWIKLPIHIGKPVWVAKAYYNKLSNQIHTRLDKGKVSMLQQKVDKSWKFRVTTKYVSDYTLDDIGIYIFFTEEEAKKALAEKIKFLEENYEVRRSEL
jgi:hypothetical protein